MADDPRIENEIKSGLHRGMAPRIVTETRPSETLNGQLDRVHQSLERAHSEMRQAVDRVLNEVAELERLSVEMQRRIKGT